LVQNIDHDEYYRALRDAPIGEIVRHYCPDRITDDNGHVWHLDCPNHSSGSKKSLQIDLDANLWNCFGCGTGGDNIQFVEFIQTASVTKNIRGSMPESHRMARDSLAQFLGLPPMATLGFSEEESARYRARLAEEQEVYRILTEYTEACHKELLTSPAVLKWVKDNYGFDDEIITQLKIGFAPTEFTD
jgi:DNA primase